MGEHALLTHAISPDKLAATTARIQKNGASISVPLALQLAAFTGAPATNNQLTCATCHQEHHGREWNLNTLTNLQCQSCHAKQFHSFQHGHPEFENYPYERRSRIYFDHAAHFNRYFVDKEFKRIMPDGHKPNSCNSCHHADSSGRSMLTGSFENTCASCHASEIVDVDFPGVAFFALPVMPPAVMKSLGEWPHTQGTFKNARLPRLMEQLLANDLNYQSGIRKITDLDYRKLNNLNPEHHAPVTDIAWSIKKLLYDISTQGELAIKHRLGKNVSEYQNLKPSIIPSLLQAQQLWFPSLPTEMKLLEEKKQLPPAAMKVEKVEASKASPTANGGWYISDADYTIRYRPIGHADPLLKHWLDETIHNQSHLSDQNSMWHIFSNPTASGTEETHGALASGRCLMCHSVDRNPETGIFKINWQPQRAKEPAEPLTQFTHAPHLIIGNQEKCTGCHSFDKSRTDNNAFFQSEYLIRDETNLFWQINFNSRQSCTSGFQAINRQSCVTCHCKKNNTQSCLQCHKYHAHQLSDNK